MAAYKKSELAKELYIRGFDIPKIAVILGIKEKSVANYRSRAKDWDKQRASNFIINGNEKEKLYENFMEEMYLSIKEVRNSTMTATEKTISIARLGDAFAKMKKIASYEDPESYKLAIVKRVITLIVNKFKNRGSADCIKSIVELIDSKEFVDALGTLNV